MTDLNPETFDLDAWLEDAERPEHAVTVYQKAGLIADLDVLAARIEAADEDDEVDGPSMGGGVGKLRAQYEALAKQFHDSALTVRVQSLTQDEQKAILEENKGLDAAELGRLILSRALVHPVATPDQLRKLNAVVGDAQFNRILQAFYQACGEVPAVSADFLPKSSGLGSSDE